MIPKKELIFYELVAVSIYYILYYQFRLFGLCLVYIYTLEVNYKLWQLLCFGMSLKLVVFFKKNRSSLEHLQSLGTRAAARPSIPKLFLQPRNSLQWHADWNPLQFRPACQFFCLFLFLLFLIFKILF